MKRKSALLVAVVLTSLLLEVAWAGEEATDPVDEGLLSILNNPAIERTFYLEDSEGQLLAEVTLLTATRRHNTARLIQEFKETVAIDSSYLAPEETEPDSYAEVIEYEPQKGLVWITRIPLMKSGGEKATWSAKQWAYVRSQYVAGGYYTYIYPKCHLFVASTAPNRNSNTDPNIINWAKIGGTWKQRWVSNSSTGLDTIYDSYPPYKMDWRIKVYNSGSTGYVGWTVIGYDITF